MTRLPALDLARGGASLAVMWCHVSTAAVMIWPWFPVFTIGRCGVEAFFVISGYVITMTTQRSASRGAFARARFIRLYPAFVAAMLITTAWVAATGMDFNGLGAQPVSLGDWLLNLTMMPDWLGAKQVEGVYWTLAYEVAFYAVVWAALPWIKGEENDTARRTNAGVLPAEPMPRLFGWRMLLERLPATARWRTNEIREALSSGRQQGLVLTPTLYLVVASLPVLWWQPIVGWFLVGVVGHECTAGRALEPSRMGGPRVATWLSVTPPIAPLCSYIGAISYPLYLLHATIGRSLIFQLSPLGPALAIGLAVAFVIGLAAAVHHFVERPVSSYAARRSAVAAVRAAARRNPGDAVMILDVLRTTDDPGIAGERAPAPLRGLRNAIWISVGLWTMLYSAWALAQQPTPSVPDPIVAAVVADVSATATANGHATQSIQALIVAYQRAVAERAKAEAKVRDWQEYAKPLYEAPKAGVAQ